MKKNSSWVTDVEVSRRGSAKQTQTKLKFKYTNKMMSNGTRICTGKMNSETAAHIFNITSYMRRSIMGMLC